MTTALFIQAVVKKSIIFQKVMVVGRWRKAGIVKGDSMIVMIIDGQGGGIGAAIIKGLREAGNLNVECWALGTNSIATSRMMKAGANRGATGENAIIHSGPHADIIVGPLAIIMPHAMMGEVTPGMAGAVSSSKARKIPTVILATNMKGM